MFAKKKPVFRDPAARTDGAANTVAPAIQRPEAITIPDAVMRCRWIAVDVGASEFGVFFVSRSLERARLLACFDSDFPKTSTSSRFVVGCNGEEIVQHARASTLPCWWSDLDDSPVTQRLGALTNTVRTAELVPCNPGLAFPVFAERGQCGLIAFFGQNIALDAEQVYDIHGRCFSLFRAIAPIGPGDLHKSPSISKREMECLKLTAKGLTSDDIAKTLKLSVHTANQYLANTAQKLNAVNRNHAVSKAIRLGIIE